MKPQLVLNSSTASRDGKMQKLAAFIIVLSLFGCGKDENLSGLYSGSSGRAMKFVDDHKVEVYAGSVNKQVYEYRLEGDQIILAGNAQGQSSAGKTIRLRDGSEDCIESYMLGRLCKKRFD